jgi:hypothetical protein
MSEPSDATPESVDVAAIMVEIREGIEERRRQGFRTPDEIEGLIEERLRAYGERAGIHPQLIKQILHPSHEWNISVDYLMRTQRPGIVGAAILGAKRAVRPFVRLYTDHILKRQEQLNLYLMYFLQDAVRQIVRLELEVAQLRKQVDEKPRGGGQA